MFQVKPTDEQREYAWLITSHPRYGLKLVYPRQQPRNLYAGMLAEVVMADGIGHSRPPLGKKFDHGIDFEIYGVNTDIKCHVRKNDPKPNPRYYYNVPAHQITDKHQTDIYVMASVNENTGILTIVGLIRQDDIWDYFCEGGSQRTHDPRDDGTIYTRPYDLYEIPYPQLKSVDSWLDLTWKINQMSI